MVCREERVGRDPGFEVRSWAVAVEREARLVEGRVVLDEDEEFVVRLFGRDDVGFEGEERRFEDEEVDVRLEWVAEVGDCGVECEVSLSA